MYKKIDSSDWAALYQSGMSLRDLAKAKGCHVDTVLKYLRAAGIERRPKQKLPRIDYAWLADQGLGKKPDSEIALATGIKVGTVQNIRKRLGIPAFTGSVLTQEGFPCRSMQEAKYDAWLHWKGVPHRHEAKIPGTLYRADFKILRHLHDGVYVGPFYVEIIGMINDPRYKAHLTRKHADYDRLCIPCQWIGRGSLEFIVRDCPVSLRFREDRVCAACGKAEYDLVHGMCRICNAKAYKRKRGKWEQCTHCKKRFLGPLDYGNAKTFYCSRECYQATLASDFRWDWVDEQLRTRKASDVAREMGIKPHTLQERISRRKRKDSSMPQLVADFSAGRI